MPEDQTLKSPYLKIGQITPRIYQTKVLNFILEKGSTLVVMPTGLGKTIIAIMLFARFFEKGAKKILFLAPTRPLVEQHYNSVSNMMADIRVNMLTGSIKQSIRNEIIQKSDIIIATPQTIENDLDKIETKFDLIIFDEAHRASGNYAYVPIAKFFDNATKVGLSASPGTTKAQIKEVMDNLGLKEIEIKAENDPDVMPYINPVDIKWIKVSLPEELLNVNKLLHEFILDEAKVIRSCGYALRHNFIQRDLLFIQKKIFEELKSPRPRPLAYQAVSSISAIMKVEHAITLLETQGIKALDDYIQRIIDEKETSKANKKIKDDSRIQKAKMIIEGLNIANIDHPKIRKLEEIILTEIDKDSSQKIIVFNNYRDSVTSLEKRLNDNPIITAKRFVGQGTKGEDKGLNQKEQKQIIEDFKEGKYNVLLATSVAEEGLDIPSVDTVIFYEPVPSDIRSIQRRGRTGRFGKGQIYVLITIGTRDEAFYYASISKEKSMKNSIVDLSKKETTAEKIKKIDQNKEIVIKPLELRQKLITESLVQSKKDESVIESNGITIIADTRERNSKTLEEIKKKECNVIEKQLDIGDYQVGDECIVERKASSDFISSIIDGRLFSQAIKLSAYEKPIIIIEGDLIETIHGRDIRKEQIYGAMFSLMLEYKIPIINTFNSIESANMIYQLAKREQQKQNKITSLRKIKKTEKIQVMQRYVVEGLPYIGPTLATRLLQKYDNIKKIFNLDEDKLSSIEGIGDKKAKEIYRIINSKYSENE